jgi:uncharacterized repeat protein (TIGR04138 family)
MIPVSFDEAMERIRSRDPRYALEAYAFVREGLDYTVKHLGKPRRGVGRHVDGRQLLDGIRLFALEQFGPIARTVLARWGVNNTQDVGEIVFNMVNEGVLGRTDEDSIADFIDGYDFEEAFVMPFLPRSLKKDGVSTVRSAEHTE